MRYSDACSAAPPGSGQFQPEDLARLRPSAIAFMLSPGPASPPLEDVAAALEESPTALHAVASALPGNRAERLLRLAQRPRPETDRARAREALVRGLFWPLVYELLPDRWDRLSRAEAVHPQLLSALPSGCELVLEVGAGTGRLTVSLVERAGRLVAVEPSPGLRGILSSRLGGYADVVAGRAPQLPVRAGSVDLVISCASFGPHAPWGGEVVVADLERCARPGGTVAFVGPEDPDWFASLGYERTSFEVALVPAPAEPELVGFFGPLAPPHELLTKKI